MRTIGSLTITEFKNLVTTTIEEVLKENFTSNAKDDHSILFNAQEASSYLKLPIQTIYNKVSKDEIPSYKLGRRRVFRKVDLDVWINTKAKSTSNIDEDVDRILGSVKNRKSHD